MPNIDWETIEADYITSDLSYKALANKYGLAYSTVGLHGSAGNWPDKRQKHRTKVKSKVVRKIETKQANELAKLQGATNDAIGIVCNALGKEDQFYTYLCDHKERYVGGVEVSEDKILSEISTTEQRKFDKIDSKALRDLTTVLKDLVQLQREFYDIPTEAQKEQRKIALDKAEIERKRNDDGKDNAVVIRFEDGSPGEWNG